MKELRTNMELFLQDVKEEIRRKDSGRDKLMLKESPVASPAASCLTTGLKEVSRCSSLLSCCQSTTLHISYDGRAASQYLAEPRKESLEGMEQLEAELEAELERFQHHMDTKCSPQSMKITSSGSIAKSSSNLSLGEVIDLNEASIQVHAAVECIAQKLFEKRREATWWKDTEPTGSSLDAIFGKL